MATHFKSYELGGRLWGKIIPLTAERERSAVRICGSCGEGARSPDT